MIQDGCRQWWHGLPARGSSCPLPIHILPLPDVDHPDGELVVLDGIDDAVAALAQAVFFLAGQLLAAGRAGVFGERFDAAENPSQVFLGGDEEILTNRPFEKDFIFI